MAHIFISYAKEDVDSAERVQQALESLGYEVWRDRERLKSHEPLRSAVETALGAAACVLILWSEKSRSSDWVLGEAETARRTGKLVQALIDDTRPPLDFQNRLYRDLAGWGGTADAAHEGWQAIRRDIALLCPPPPRGLGPDLAWLEAFETVVARHETKLNSRVLQQLQCSAEALRSSFSACDDPVNQGRMFYKCLTHLRRVADVTQGKPVLGRDGEPLYDEVDASTIRRVFNGLVLNTLGGRIEGLLRRDGDHMVPPAGVLVYDDLTEAEQALIDKLLGELETRKDDIGTDPALAVTGETEKALGLVKQLRFALLDQEIDLAHLTFILGLIDDLVARADVLRRTLDHAEAVAGIDAGKLPDFAVFRSCIDLEAGLFGPEMVVIPGGTFLMGAPEDEEGRSDDEGPQHGVTVPRFAMGRFAVTFDDYDAFCGETGRERPGDGDWGRGRRPVIHVSWDDAQAYCAWASERTGAAYRLPSEAEWEYACRAGTTTPFSFGETISTDQANYDGDISYGNGRTGEDRQQSNGIGFMVGGPIDDRKQTTPVGTFPANAFGLHDMHGNVQEWCEDLWHDSYAGAPADGSAWVVNQDDFNARVVRGGSGNNKPIGLRSADRSGVGPVNRFDTLGLRVARTL